MKSYSLVANFTLCLFLMSCASSLPSLGDYDSEPIRTIYDEVRDVSFYSSRYIDSVYNQPPLSIGLRTYIGKSGDNIWFRMVVRNISSDAIHFDEINFLCSGKRFQVSSSLQNRWDKDFDTSCSTGTCVTTEKTDVSLTRENFKKIVECEEALTFRLSGRTSARTYTYTDEEAELFIQGGKDLISQLEKLN